MCETQAKATTRADRGAAATWSSFPAGKNREASDRGRLQRASNPSVPEPGAEVHIRTACLHDAGDEHGRVGNRRVGELGYRNRTRHAQPYHRMGGRSRGFELYANDSPAGPRLPASGPRPRSGLGITPAGRSTVERGPPRGEEGP